MTIEAMRFEPQVVMVAPGDRITWRNKDPFPHTVTADEKGFNSGNVAAEASWTFVARAVGNYPYACLLHPTMTGTLIVKTPADKGTHE